jgi:uncharacterized protein
VVEPPDVVRPLRRVLAFFGAACVLTAVCQAPAIVALRAGEAPSPGAMLLMVLGSSGPTLVAIAFALAFEGRAGLRALFRRGIRTTQRLPLGVVAVGHIFAAHMIGSAALYAVGQYSAQHLAYPPLQFEHYAIAVIAPIGEEYGWRGYALPRLQRVMTPLNASLLIGVVWVVWHVPSAFMPGTSLYVLLLFLPLMLAGSMLYTWLFNATGGSMLVIVLAHLGAHLDSLARAIALDGWSPAIATTVVMVLFAIAVVMTGRLNPGRVPAVTT